MRKRILTKMIWMFMVVIFCMLEGKFVIAQQITKTSFSCEGRPTGYYADVTTGCQVYHMCDGLGRKFSYTCPNATLFQQRMLICDHWYMVNCSRATADYSANLLIGQRNKPFVENSGSNTFSRTPRPDLLSAPSNPTEHNIVYRTGEQNLSPRDFVGVESGDQSTYFPPGHWSTEIKRQPSSPQLTTRSDKFNAQIKNRGKAIDLSSQNKNRNTFGDNHKFNFKSTTPVEDSGRFVNNIKLQSSVFSKDQKPTLSLELLPPIVNNQESIDRQDQFNAFNVNFPSNFKATTPQYPSEDELLNTFEAKLKGSDENNQPKINFKSNFKATTPIYPNTVDLTSLDPYRIGVLPPHGIINFQSNFKATTPQYPSSVESTSVAPDIAGLLPPQIPDQYSGDNKNTETVKFQSNFKATTPSYPTFVEQTSPNPFDVGISPPKVNDDINDNIAINFNSNFKATTPQYPSHVDPTSPDPNEAGILPPNDDNQNVPINFESKFKATTPQYPSYVDPTSPNPNDVGLVPPKPVNKVVFKSRFKATTPNYPTFVEATSPNPIDVGLIAPVETLVNFHSDFKATTPNYPVYVEPTSPDPSKAGLLAPQPDRLIGLENTNQNTKSNDKNWSFLNFQSDYNVGEDELQEIPGIKILNFMKSFNDEQWQEVRQAFRIPEYEFPLEDATRPSYSSVVNSFEPNK